MEQLIVDFDSKESKQKLFNYLKALRGIKTISFRDEKRSEQQVRYYFKCIVTPFAEFIGEEDIAKAHYLLKMMHLSEIITVGKQFDLWKVKELGELGVREMSEYIEKCIVYLAINFDFVVSDSEEWKKLNNHE